MEGVEFEDDVGQVELPIKSTTVYDLQQQAIEFYGNLVNEGDDHDKNSSKDGPKVIIEYYDGTTWNTVPTESTRLMDLLQQFATQQKMLPIRIPYLFDESDHADFAEDTGIPPLWDTGNNNANNASTSPLDDVRHRLYPRLSEAIQVLQTNLQQEGYTPIHSDNVVSFSSSEHNSSNDHYYENTVYGLYLEQQQPNNTNNPNASDTDPSGTKSMEDADYDTTKIRILTRDWVLQQARNSLKGDGSDCKLANTLLMQVGALSHICHTLHNNHHNNHNE